MNIEATILDVLRDGPMNVTHLKNTVTDLADCAYSEVDEAIASLKDRGGIRWHGPSVLCLKGWGYLDDA